MAMYSAGIPVFTTMLLGRWSSNAFLRYIRKQVKEFSSGVSQKMITHEDFFTVPLSTSESNERSNYSLNLTSRNKMASASEKQADPLISTFS
jgi:hypothetical protein